MAFFKVCSASTVVSHGCITVASLMFSEHRRKLYTYMQVLALAVDTTPFISVSHLQVYCLYYEYMTGSSHIFLSSQATCQLSIINT